MTFAAAWNAVLRAVAAVLLMLTVATPALAEVGCASEAVAHLADGSAGAAHQADASGQPDGGHEEGQAGHCAFSHGHCTAIPPAASADTEPMPIRASFARFVADPMIVRDPEALERPPAA